MKKKKPIYWGKQTKLAAKNFPNTGYRLPVSFVHNLVRLKQAAAYANNRLGLLSNSIEQAIRQASDEVLSHKWDDQFIVDLFQTGSATSTHMNVNEVLANRSTEILAQGPDGEDIVVHPNDHVNLGQSSNDVIPTTIHVCMVLDIETKLIPELKDFAGILVKHSKNWDSLIKPGRTHLQDATPIRIGQVFSGYAHVVQEAIRRVEMALAELRHVALGGTAVGTGINTHPDFARLALERLSANLNTEFKETNNHFSAQSTIDPILSFMNQINTTTTALMKVANDIRWLSCGPRTGFAEFKLPSLQAGSSIMPGKVNPVIIESFLQISCQVLGACHVVNLAAQRSEFELNVFLPLTAYNVISSIGLLSLGLHHLNEFCFSGLLPDIEHCRKQAGKSLSIATAMAKKYGYDQTAAWVEKAMMENKTIHEIIREERILTEKEEAELSDLIAMTHPSRE